MTKYRKIKFIHIRGVFRTPPKSAINIFSIILNSFYLLTIFAEKLHREAATRGVLLEKVFLKILQNSTENTCASVSLLIKLQV